MAISLVSNRTLKDFFQNGGKIEYEIDAEDIASDFPPQKNEYPANKEFKIPPTSAAYGDSSFFLDVMLHANEWNKILVGTYFEGGEVIYTMLTSGKIRAVCSIPIKTI